MNRSCTPAVMFRTAATFAALALCAGAAPLAQQPTDQDKAAMERMQAEIEQLKAELRSLKEKIDAMAKPSPEIASQATPAVEEPSQVSPSTPPEFTPPPRAAGAGNAFNPAISAVFQGIGNSSVNHNRDDDGLTLSEAEIGLQAVVDPYARVDMFFTFSSEGDAEVEEAFATFQTLPGGLQAKAGRFKSAFGKWNQLHDHAFFSVDRPDALQAFFGEESLTGDGASLSWLVPGTGSAFIESVSEVASTPNDVSFNARRRDLLYLQRLSAVLTLTPNATLELGASGAAGSAGPTERVLDEIDDAGLSGTLTPADRLSSNVFGADLTYKWKPVQHNVYQSFLWQTEALQSVRRVEELDPSGTLTRRTVRSAGGYSLVEYQFAKRWRAGVRFDATGFADDDSARQQSESAILRVQPTEFQEFRFQVKHTSRNQDAAFMFDGIQHDNEFFIEWIPVIGAHAAHKY